jgi:hypothetical protein
MMMRAMTQVLLYYVVHGHKAADLYKCFADTESLRTATKLGMLAPSRRKTTHTPQHHHNLLELGTADGTSSQSLHHNIYLHLANHHEPAIRYRKRGKRGC